MGQRNIVLATGETYHVFNRSAHKVPIFTNKREFAIFTDAMSYYLQASPPIKFSKYRQNKKSYKLDMGNKLVTIINYCIMPTHFHFTLRQDKEEGIRFFVQKLTSSFAHYLNTKNESIGPVFAGNFKAVRVENDDQLIHLSRYIHLNPVTDYLVKKPEDYSYSSYRIYLRLEDSNIVDPSLIMKNYPTENYRKFVESQIDYQRELNRIKHLTLE